MASTFQDMDPDAIGIASIQSQPDSLIDTRCGEREVGAVDGLNVGDGRHTRCSGYDVADGLESEGEIPRPGDDQYSIVRQLSCFETTGLDELEAGAPDENPEENDEYRASRLENKRAKEQAGPHRREFKRKALAEPYDHSHLIFFSILGVLARLGLVALTSYPGAPIATTVVWANVGGSLIMGFLREDRLLFRRHWH